MKKLTLVLFIVVISLLTACSGGEGPSEAVESFYDAANDFEYSTAEKWVAEEVYNYVESSGNSLTEGIDGFTRGGNVESMDILDETVTGEKAEVIVKVTFKDGSTDTKEIPMYFEDDVWKIGLAR